MPPLGLTLGVLTPHEFISAIPDLITIKTTPFLDGVEGDGVEGDKLPPAAPLFCHCLFYVLNIKGKTVIKRFL
jgi:hypothetical protein